MSRATGGVYLDAEQQESYNNAQEWASEIVSSLNKLHVIGPKRVDSTTRKLNNSLVKFIAKGGYVSETGMPDLSEMDNWTLTETVSTEEE